MLKKVAPENWINLMSGPSQELTVAVNSITDVTFFFTSNLLFYP